MEHSSCSSCRLELLCYGLIVCIVGSSSPKVPGCIGVGIAMLRHVLWLLYHFAMLKCDFDMLINNWSSMFYYSEERHC